MIYRDSFYSEVLGVNTYYLIAYPENTVAPLPGIVLLRATPEEWLDGTADHSRGERHVLTILQDLMEQGYCPPLAFILPRTTNVSQTAFISHGTALRPDLMVDRSFIGRGAMNDFMDLELLPRSIATGLIQPGKMAIDGFSLGGASSIYHALRRPDVFVSCGSYDGAFLKYEYDDPRIFPDTPSDLRLDEFPYLFGYPPDVATFRWNNVLDVVRQFTARQWQDLPRLMIHYANEEGPTANGWRVRELLATPGVRNYAYTPSLHPHSAHSWWWVDEHLYRTLPFHAYFLQSHMRKVAKEQAKG